MKPIVFTRHARWQMRARSVSDADAIETIRKADSTQLARRGAMKALKTFPFSALHSGMFYQYKKVEVRYLDRPTDFLVLTVISRFFS
jgi:hypothetical protein